MSREEDDFKQYMKQVYQYIDPYLPPKEQWTPVEEALVKPVDLFRVPEKELEELQFKAIKYQFQNQYKNNHVYQQFCKGQNISPENIKTPQDLYKIPVLPDGFFKQYPEGKDFATWLGNMYTGELPKITIKQRNPNYDQVLEAFNQAGMIVAFSSGTSGRHTFIPRDQRTFNLSQFALAKAAVAMLHPLYEYNVHGYMLMPNPKRVNIWAGRNLEVYEKVITKMNYAIDRPITTETIRASMGGARGVKASVIRKVASRTFDKMLNDMIKWFEEHENSDQKVTLMGAPWILYFALQRAKEQGKSFDFSGRSAVVTGGGWKIHENKRLSTEDFRKEVNEVLGVDKEFILDVYNMVEGNCWCTQCPEGHYLHITSPYFKPIVLDDEFKPIEGYGEAGRFAFLDALAFGYPGFITTGDKVRILEHCPVCDRPGPVLAPEIKRAAGTETRGCAEEMRRMMSKDLGR